MTVLTNHSFSKHSHISCVFEKQQQHRQQRPPSIQGPSTPESVNDEADDSSTLTEFDKLIADIKRLMGPCSGLDSSEVSVDALMERLEQYVSRDEDWQRYAFFDPAYGYTRNGVDDINSKANLLILVWSPGQGSAIHDHANAHCLVKVLSGQLVETRYSIPPDGAGHNHLHAMRVSTYGRDQVTYMSDKIGLHKMYNPGSKPTVSLHLYTPPWAATFGCNIYEEDSGEKHHVKMNALYSNNGVRLAGKPCSC